MKKFSFGQEYYLTNYEEINEYLKFLLNDNKDKRIKYIFLNSGLTWSDTNHGKRYETLSDIFIVFDNDAVLKINYLFYSLIYIEYTWFQNISRRDKEYNNDEFKLELDVANTSIENFSIERFSESYEIDPSSGAVRPEGDYFKTITLNLSNGSNLCICAQDSESDGYCNVWIENTIEKIEEKIRNSEETVDANLIKEWSMTHLNETVGKEANGLIPFNVQQFNEFSLAYHHDLMSYAGLWGFMDKKGNVIVEPRYLFEPLECNGLYIVCEGSGWKHTPDLPEGKIWSEVQKWGVIDKNQNVIIPIEYDQIDELYNDTKEDAEIFGTLFTVFRHQYKPYDIQEVALFNSKGEQIIPFFYNDFGWSYCDGQLIVYKGNDRYGDYFENRGFVGIYDLIEKKEIIVPNKYKYIDYIEKDLFLVSFDAEYGYYATIINDKNEVIGEEKMWKLIFINNYTSSYRYKGETMEDKYYYFNIKNNNIVDITEISEEQFKKF